MRKLLLLPILSFFVCVANAQHANGSDSLQQYAGKYKFPDGSVITEVIVSLDSSNVLMASSAMGSSELRKGDGDMFEIVAYGGVANFKRNAEGKISGLVIIVGDINIEGTKTEGALHLLRESL